MLVLINHYMAGFFACYIAFPLTGRAAAASGLDA